MYFQEREQPYSQLQRNEGPNPDKRPMSRAWLGCGQVWETMGDEAAGAQGQVMSLTNLTKESGLQCMDSGEQLKTFKQGNTVVHLAFFDKSLWQLCRLGYRFPRQVAGDSHPDQRW